MSDNTGFIQGYNRWSGNGICTWDKIYDEKDKIFVPVGGTLSKAGYLKTCTAKS